GISYGIVLGADNRPPAFIRYQGFTNWEDYGGYSEKKGEFDRAYQQGLVAGLVYGRKMNAAQKSKFRKAVRSHMTMPDYPPLSDQGAWQSGRNFKKYYQIAAATFKRYMLRK